MCTKYDPTLDPSLFSETVQNKMVVGSFNLMMYFQPNVKYMIKISSDHLLDCYLVVYIEKYCKIGPNKAAFIGSGLKQRYAVHVFSHACRLDLRRHNVWKFIPILSKK